MNKRLHIIVKGRVQGVFYRHNTKVKALELDLSGYVRNMPSGEVEVVAEGPEEKLKMLLEWCRRGPEYAEVTDVEVKWDKFAGEFLGFSVKY